MKTRSLGNARAQGYTLLEMIGVLAMMGILAAILIPKIFGLVDDANLVAEVESVKGMRKATEVYYQKYGKLGGVDGVDVSTWLNNACEYWDRDVLLREQFAETAMRSRLATNAYIRLVKVTTTSKTTDILTAPGPVGHLPAFNGNNGYYNLTQEYAANAKSAESLYAFAGSLPLNAPRLSGALAAGVGGLSGFAPPCKGLPEIVRLAGNRGNRLILPIGKGLLRFLGSMLQQSGSPFQCCYPVPTTWKTPTPGFGGGTSGTGPGNPSHNNPGADSQIYAGSSSSPAIVAELVLEGVSVENAYRLSLAVDGYTQSNWAFWDSLGRVKYDMYNGSGGTKSGVVFVYLGHQ